MHCGLEDQLVGVADAAQLSVRQFKLLLNSERVRQTTGSKEVLLERLEKHRRRKRLQEDCGQRR